MPVCSLLHVVGGGAIHPKAAERIACRPEKPFTKVSERLIPGCRRPESRVRQAKVNASSADNVFAFTLAPSVGGPVRCRRWQKTVLTAPERHTGFLHSWLTIIRRIARNSVPRTQKAHEGGLPGARHVLIWDRPLPAPATPIVHPRPLLPAKGEGAGRPPLARGALRKRGFGSDGGAGRWRHPRRVCALRRPADHSVAAWQGWEGGCCGVLRRPPCRFRPGRPRWRRYCCSSVNTIDRSPMLVVSSTR